MSTPAASKNTFHGSCHCGQIKYQVALSIGETPIASRCNCTVCVKRGFTGVRVPKEDFTLLAPGSPSQLGDYQMRSPRLHKYFCHQCGVHVWNEGILEFEGREHELFSVNIQTIDQPQEGLDLSKFKIEYYDGLNDNWMAGARDTPWPNGCI